MPGRPEKFLALKKHLQKKAKEFHESGETDLPMTLKGIEHLGVSLPPSAYKYHAWWSDSHYGRPWEKTGFQPKAVDLKNDNLVFRYSGNFSNECTLRQLNKQLKELENDLSHRESQLGQKKGIFERLNRQGIENLGQKIAELKQKIAELRKKSNMSPEVTGSLGMADAPRVYKPEQKKCHPAFGSMKGMLRIVAGTDLTEPVADPKSWKPR